MFNDLINIYNYIRPVIDIGVLTFLLYKIYGLIVKTNAVQLIKGGIALALLYTTALVLNLTTILWLLNTIAPGLLIGIAIIFQPELRKMFFKIGQSDWFKFGNRSNHSHLDSVLTAAEMLSNQRRGMLAVFIRHTDLKDIAETGTRLNAELSSSLLLTIFGHDTPLHDGATLIQGGKVHAAGCFLPLSEQHDIKKTFGTRHRSALGLSEETDAVILVVSEETGAMSLAYDSKLYYDLTMAQLIKTLESLLDLHAEGSAKDSEDESKITP